MTYDQFNTTFAIVKDLVAILAWPTAFLYLIIRFRAAVGDFLESVREFSFKGFGFEANGRRAEAVAALAAATLTRDTTTRGPIALDDARRAAEAVSAVSISSIREFSRSRVLWVDDNPDNNVYERRSMEALGIRFVLAVSTEDALEKISQESFDLIISDMGRPLDPRAGYTLLDMLRKQGDNIPYVIYASSRSPQHQAESRQHGAIGCTNRPDELLRMVTAGLSQGSSKRL